MHAEHEEAMRADYSDRAAESWKAFWSGVTDAEAYEIRCRVAEYDQRWRLGPHAQEWEFLRAAHADWRDRPEDMRRFTEDIDTHRKVYDDFGLTEVQRRSIAQAAAIASEERSAIGALTPPPPLRQPIQRER